MLHVLGISGRIGAGKDTLAETLRSWMGWMLPGHMFLRVGLADPIKEMLILTFGVPREIAYGTQEQKRQLMPRGTMTVRKAAQTLGRAMQEVDPGVFCDLAARTIRVHNRHVQNLFVCITDVRFPREIDMVRSFGGRVLRLTRAAEPGDAHGSETALDGYGGFDAVVDNAGEMTRLETAAHAVVAMKGWGWVRANAKP